MLDKELVMNVARTYANVVKNAFSTAKVLLFGSYVNGTPNDESDIDIAVVLDGYNADWLDTASYLYTLRGMLKGEERLYIEPHLFNGRNRRDVLFIEDIEKYAIVLA